MKNGKTNKTTETKNDKAAAAPATDKPATKKATKATAVKPMRERHPHFNPLALRHCLQAQCRHETRGMDSQPTPESAWRISQKIFGHSELRKLSFLEVRKNTPTFPVLALGSQFRLVTV